PGRAGRSPGYPADDRAAPGRPADRRERRADRGAGARAAGGGGAPTPRPPSRPAGGAAVDRLAAGVREQGTPNIVWLSDGVAARADEAAGFAQRLQQLGRLTVLSEAADGLPLLLRAPPNDPAGMELRVQRPEGGAARTVAVRGVGADGRLVTRQEVRFASG